MAGRRINKYKLVIRESPDDLEREVTEWVNSYGFEVLGGPFWDGYNYCQAVVKYE